MIVYADLLIILNFIVDYFLILTVGWILKTATKTLRYISGALVSALSSLYIFVPINSGFIDFWVKIVICGIAVLVTFGFKNIKSYIKAFLLYLGITCLYAGVMTAVWHIVSPAGMFVKNSVVYFDFSPLMLIGFTVIFYFAFRIFSVIFKNTAVSAKMCGVSLKAGEKSINFTALVDSGNSINDVFGKSEIIIADKSVAVSLFDTLDREENTELITRYRVVPCGTVSGCGVLEGYRCDSAIVKTDREEITLDNPILAVSKLSLNQNYYGIVNPEVFNLE